MGRTNVRVRPATGADIAALTQLVRSIDTTAGTFSGTALADSSTAHLEERFGEIIATNERALLVAEDESGAVVGMLSARSDDIGAIDTTPVLAVTHLIVLPGHRRRGIGRALLSAAVQLADEAGVDRVLASAASGSREGNRYLARIGFAPLVVHRIASTATLRRSLGMTDTAGRLASLRRARLIRAQRSGFGARTAQRRA